MDSEKVYALHEVRLMIIPLVCSKWHLRKTKGKIIEIDDL